MLQIFSAKGEGDDYDKAADNNDAYDDLRGGHCKNWFRIRMTCA